MENKVLIKQFKNKAKKPVAGLTPEHAIYDKNGVRLDAKLGNVNLSEFRKAQDDGIKALKEQAKGSLEILREYDHETIINNGTINNAADEEDITVRDNVLSLKDRTYTEGINEMGYVILRKNKSFAEQVIKENTIYEIRYNFNLNGEEVTIPKGCTLKFEGGVLINGSIIYNDTIINGEYIRNIKTVCKGKVLGYANVFMYGASGNGIDDDTLALNNAVQSGCSAMHIPAGNYIISNYIMPIDNINIYGDGDATIITNTVETGDGKGAFLVGYMASRKHYPSQYSIDVHNCTIGEDFAEVESEVESNTYDIGDIVILRDTTLLDEDTFKALYVNRIIKKEGNKLYFERKINNHFLFEASTVVIGNVSKLRASSPSDDIGFIMTPYWPYEKNTCHVAYNVSISNLSIDEKYPYTGSGMYGIFINGYECHIQNVKMLNVTSPFGSNISAFCSYTNITAYYSGGISDMAELQIENIFDDITFLSKGKHPIHYGESFTLGNGYSNTLSRIIIYGPEGVGNINFYNSPDSIIINSQLYNLYRPSAGNSAISGATYGETTIMNCYIRNKKVGVVQQGALMRVIGCVFNTEGNAIGANPHYNYDIVSCISKNELDSDYPILGNLFGRLKPITKAITDTIIVSPTNTEIIFNEKANIKYGTYAELEAPFAYYNISINITIGGKSNSINLTSDNTTKYVKLRLIRVRTAGIRLMLYENNALIKDISSFIASEDLSILPFIISVTNDNSNYTTFITRPILNIYN